MTPCSVTMFRKSLLIFAVITWFTAQAITITIDRADVKTLQPHSSMTINGWRPLTTRYEEIGVNVSPSSNLERNAPLHPVLNKLQEHMAASERIKPQRKNKPQEYSPPSILGSFTVFGHAATKARGEVNSDKQYLPKETKEYSFLIPPPRDTYRFEVDPPHKKSVMRENEAYIRQGQFMSQIHKPDIRGPPYFVKSPPYSTTVHPMLATKNRPVASAYSLQSSFIAPPHQPVKSSTFESLKVNSKTNSNRDSNKQYFNGPKAENSDHNYERYTPQSHITTVSGNFYNQVSHTPSHLKTTFERDPSYLVHESHEIGFVTPPFEYKFRHPVSFESLIRPDLYQSTNSPRPESNKKYAQPSSYRNEQMKPVEPKRKAPSHSTEKTIHPTYYVAEAPHHDYIIPPGGWPNKQFKPDINEVLPKVNSPPHFNQQNRNIPPIHPLDPQSQKVVYLRPELQNQKQQYQGSIIPLNINQRPLEKEYETPESISLKHFNEQQFMLQQQLIEQDRRRLREQEMQRQKQIEKQQQEEIEKKQQELKILEQQQQQEPTDFKKEVPKRKQNNEQVVKQHTKAHNHRYPSERTKIKAEKPKEQQEKKIQPSQQFYEAPQVSTEPSFQFTDDYNQNQQGQRYEIGHQNDYLTTKAEGIVTESDFRAQRPQAPPREPTRRRKPIYEGLAVTEDPTEIPETVEIFTEIPIQTTTWEPFTTTSAPEKIRTRKPIANTNAPRRRRPSTTTSEPETVPTNSYDGEDYYKYEKHEITDLSKRRRPKPQSTHDGTSSSVESRKPGTRKRPSHRYTPTGQENYGSDVTSEAVNPTLYENQQKGYENYEKYLERHAKNESTYITEYTPTYSQANPVDYQTEVVTENVGTEYPNVQAGKLTKFEYYEPTSHDVGTHGGQYVQHSDENLPLEHLFVRTEPGNYETTTTTAVSTGYYTNNITPTRTTIKISKSQEISKATLTPSTTTQAPSSTTKAHHRIRPLRYGNATRPRFSVKDYKTRMDLKNKIAQSAASTTEQPIRKRPTTQRNIQQPSVSDPGLRETTGKYKYMSRVSYKTTSTTTPSPHISENNASPTTEKTKFTPKRRMNPNLYRSRFTSTKASNGDASTTQSNTFPSNRRRVPVNKSHDRGGEKRGGPSTEMAAEETSFYSQPTTTQYTESVNEIGMDKDSSSQSTIDDNNNVVNEEKGAVTVSSSSTESLPQDAKANNNERQTSLDIASATPYDAKLEEELFVKASQSVADLTSSASALYNKPGLFKAVASVQENRMVKNKLLVTTEEPTLPIEAFFQELSKKID